MKTVQNGDLSACGFAPRAAHIRIRLTPVLAAHRHLIHLEQFSNPGGFIEVLPSDLEILTRIYVAAFLEWPWRELHAPDDVRSRFDEVLRWPETIFLVVRDLEGRPIGAGIAFGAVRKSWLGSFLAERMQPTLFISELFVDPAQRGRGVCRELVVGLLQRAREAGYTEILVGTSVHQMAIRRLFVQRLGFQEIAEEDYASPRALPDATLPTRRVLMRGTVTNLEVE